jgi:hypothetical protein
MVLAEYTTILQKLKTKIYEKLLIVQRKGSIAQISFGTVDLGCINTQNAGPSDRRV